jgi:hypothetical protein
MAGYFIAETPPTHPGIMLYVCLAKTQRRRAQYVLEGKIAQAIRFPDEATASLAIMQFSSLYGLRIREIPE